MKLTLKIAKVLVKLTHGETVNSSAAKSKRIDELIAENIIFSKGRHQKTLHLTNKNSLEDYLANQWQIHDLDKYIAGLESSDTSRADMVKITTDSKQSKERAFKGFLVNSYHSINATLNNDRFVIDPPLGSFVFIFDYERFKIPTEITVVGMENAQNFRFIQKQKYLFHNIVPLFVSRYPQNQNKDFINWMKSIPNNYLHFGDFDTAGISIYLNEYKRHLQERASFFIPKNIEVAIKERGNRERFDKQQCIRLDAHKIEETKILDLIKTINKEQKGLDQEYFIQ